MSGSSWVTLATNDTYCLGALVLAHSLRRVATRHQLSIIITPDVSMSMREQLSKVFDVVQLVNVLDSEDAANLALLQRPELGITFTKIHCWTLTQFSKCVFLDADTLVMQNCDELMERDELSAAPDPGWPDCFNSGVFVFVPSMDTFKQLVQFASTHGSFDGGDQGLLNMYFNDWPTSDIRKHLSFLYNMCSTSTYTYLPALNYYGANIKIVHFIGTNKPWLLGPSGAGLSSFNQAWWDTFHSSVVQHLNKNMTGLAGALGSKEKSAIEEQWRKQNWEQGNIDFTGKDSFENIWRKILEAVNKPRVEDVKQPLKKDEKPMAPKEIASQAIPEREKAEPKMEVDAAKPPLLEKNNEQLPPLVPIVEAAVGPQTPPIPLPDASLPQQVIPPLPQVPIPPLPSEVSKQPEQPIVPVEPAKENIFAPLQAPLTGSSPLLQQEVKLDQSPELMKIEDILKGLEQQLLTEEAKDLPAVIQEMFKPPEAPVEMKKTEETQASPAQTAESLKTDLPKAEEIKPETPKLPDTPKAEEVKPDAAAPKATEEIKPTAPKPEAPKAPEAPKSDQKVEDPKASEVLKAGEVKPVSEAPKTDASQTEKPKSVECMSEVEKADIPKPEPTDAPLLEPVKAESPKEKSKADVPKSEAPKADAPKAEEPKEGAPKPETPMSDAPMPEAPKSDAPIPEAPKADTPKSEETKSDAPIPEAPKVDSPKPEEPKADAPKPESPKVDAPKPEAPKAPEPSKTDVPVAQPETPKLEAPKDSQPPAGVPTASQKEGEKQKTPPKDQSKGKQPAPQPPPKNGKQKKGQQPQPTSAHPLTETPEEQKGLPQDPLTPPLSPDSSVEKVQPGTPTVIAPTPPVSPLDAPKGPEDPLSEVQMQETQAGASSGADVPVPPKRKGKGNNNQPQKPQNNGGNKGKGKK